MWQNMSEIESICLTSLSSFSYWKTTLVPIFVNKMGYHERSRGSAKGGFVRIASVSAWRKQCLLPQLVAANETTLE